MNEQQTHCGYVAILGRPNVGKSTLLNILVGQKVSIVCHKKQTTRHAIRGIKTQGLTQAIYIDTPGLHQKTGRALNNYMNQVARSVIHDADVVLFVVAATHWTDDDELVLKELKQAKSPVILVVNKIDEVANNDELLLKVKALSEKMAFAAVVPVSARKGRNLTALEQVIADYLPAGPHFYQEDQATDHHETFLIAEIIREKLFKIAHQEVPYSTTVSVEKIETKNKVMHIYATIYVEKQGQKAIVIGNQGANLKQVGQQARKELEKMFSNKVYLQLWVKVKESWADNARLMKDLGFD